MVTHILTQNNWKNNINNNYENEMMVKNIFFPSEKEFPNDIMPTNMCKYTGYSLLVVNQMLTSKAWKLPLYESTRIVLKHNSSKRYCS